MGAAAAVGCQEREGGRAVLCHQLPGKGQTCPSLLRAASRASWRGAAAEGSRLFRDLQGEQATASARDIRAASLRPEGELLSPVRSSVDSTGREECSLPVVTVTGDSTLSEPDGLKHWEVSILKLWRSEV